MKMSWCRRNRAVVRPWPARGKGSPWRSISNLPQNWSKKGFARDLIRQLNNMRKDAGLEISDRIEVGYTAAGTAASALTTFADYIAAETLAVSLSAAVLSQALATESITIGDDEVTLTLKKTN